MRFFPKVKEFTVDSAFRAHFAETQLPIVSIDATAMGTEGTLRVGLIDRIESAIPFGS